MTTPKHGASLSIKQCRNFGIDDVVLLKAALKDLGLRRFRLMSYWNEHEKEQGIYDFSTLDKQINIIENMDAVFSLCLGVRQPRWPESHWPNWALELPLAERNEALLKFIEIVVKRYRKSPSLISYQLENEALLKNFGERGDFDRQRLIHEYRLVKKLDKKHPVIMTTSTSWGIPVRQPIPDIVGFSMYRKLYQNGQYRTSLYQPWVFKLRANLIKLILQKPTFIHELQAEPWGPANIWDMSAAEQAQSMSVQLLHANIQAACHTGLYPIDLWGLEWWYWLKTKSRNPQMWDTVRDIVS